MESMLQSRYLSVLEAKTRDAFQTELVRFTRQAGFETVSATTVIDHFLGEPEFITVDNTPAAYLATFQDRNGGKRDPVMQHCKVKSVPIVWDQSTYIKGGEADKWEFQARFGYRYGISLVMHMPKGLHFTVGVVRDQPLPTCSDQISRMTADLQLFLVHAQETAMRVLLPPAVPEQSLPRLTPRELECLRWTMEGKTAWELGQILGIAEQTAVRHIQNAARKLDCVSKHQAVLKAVRLKFIW
jgi:DNA-binding CsgD family transcriptional regulator